MTYSYNLPTGNNGSVSSITNSLNPGLSPSFTYDSLNRVLSGATASSSVSGCWGQSFGPSGNPPPGPPEDRYGNLAQINSTQCNSPWLSITVNASTNQITSTGFAYDSDGNMTQDGSGSGYNYSYDGENRLTQANGMSGGPWNYIYDGNSVRVKKSNSSGGTIYWRSIWGDALAESDLQGNFTNEYVFMAGRRIARRDSSGNVYYYYPDALGSPLTITNSSGNPCYVASYTPYGQEMATTNTCPQNYKFAGYEQDTETGLYYAYARYYSPRLGRFLSPDPLGGATSNPQSLNSYAYVMNNPGNFIDPLGLECGNNIFYACNDPWGFGGATCVIDGAEQFSCNTAGIFLSSGAGYLDFPGMKYIGDNNDWGSNCYAERNTEGKPTCLGDLLSLILFTAPKGGPGGGPQQKKGGQKEKPKVEAQPLSLWEKIAGTIGCFAGLDPENAKPIDLGGKDTPQDSADSPEGHTSGQQVAKTAKGQHAPLNPEGSRSQIPGGVAGGTAQAATTAQCIANIWTAWPTKHDK